MPLSPRYCGPGAWEGNELTMTICRYLQLAICGMTLAGALPARPAAPNQPGSLPPFQEVFGMIKSNLVAASEAELNRAAVLGLVSQLQSRVALVTNGVSSTDELPVPLVSKTTSFDGTYGFLRVGKVGEGLPAALAGAYDQLRNTNILKGLILDLR